MRGTGCVALKRATAVTERQPAANLLCDHTREEMHRILMRECATSWHMCRGSYLLVNPRAVATKSRVRFGTKV